jgi:hypothetical protein
MGEPLAILHDHQQLLTVLGSVCPHDLLLGSPQ